jgi:hypothetical protein
MTDPQRQPAQVLPYGTPATVRRRPWLFWSLVAVLIFLLVAFVVFLVAATRSRAAERRAVFEQVRAQQAAATQASKAAVAATQKAAP